MGPTPDIQTLGIVVFGLFKAQYRNVAGLEVLASARRLESSKKKSSVREKPHAHVTRPRLFDPSAAATWTADVTMRDAWRCGHGCCTRCRTTRTHCDCDLCDYAVKRRALRKKHFDENNSEEALLEGEKQFKERLNGLATLCIEKRLLDEIDIDTIINDFASRNVRRNL
ncbi:hypothetical protein E2562_014568 [Oryza meyeriana var. granulata]|uniref:Uncharacterized protein n=1 Tax=Oryza meyeriana var. granulata TaxID=110450 RepID=A0A6G1EJ40_9ORYZ|nr:hypothetical protein E2562_014568 [Oryza meyeriana var. granulata]